MPEGHHLGQLILLAIVVGWPAPLCLALQRRMTAGDDAPPRSEVLLVWLLGWWAAELALVMVLGMLHLYRVEAICAAGIAAAAIGIWDLRRRGTDADPATARARPPLDLASGIVVGLLAAAGLALLWHVASHPSANFDTLNYHLPAAAEFYQDGAFTRLPAFRTSADYPFGLEAMASLFLFPFGEDLASGLPNLVMWFLLAVACLRLGRLLGARRPAALLGAVLVAASPHLVQRVAGLQVEIAVAALFLASCCFALRWRRRQDARSAFLLMVCGGLLCSCKFIGGLYWLLALVLVVLPANSAWPAWRPSRRALIGGVAVALVLTGYWYLRNLVEAGSIFGDVDVGAGGEALRPYRGARSGGGLVRIPPGMFTSELGWPLYPLLGLAAFSPVAILRSRTPRARWLLLALPVLLLATAALYYAVSLAAARMSGAPPGNPPPAHSIRFAYPCLALLGVLAGLGATWLRLPGLLLAACAAPVIAAGARTLVSWRVLLAALACGALALAAGVLVSRSARAGPRLGRTVAILLLLLVAAGFSWPARSQREVQRHVLFGDGYTELESLASAADAVGLVLSNRTIAFYGRDLERQVIALRAQGRSREEWLAAVRDAQVDVVGIGPLARRMRGKVRREQNWLSGGGAGSFRPIHDRGKENGISLFAVQRQLLDGS